MESLGRKVLRVGIFVSSTIDGMKGFGLNWKRVTNFFQFSIIMYWKCFTSNSAFYTFANYFIASSLKFSPRHGANFGEKRRAQMKRIQMSKFDTQYPPQCISISKKKKISMAFLGAAGVEFHCRQQSDPKGLKVSRFELRREEGEWASGRNVRQLFFCYSVGFSADNSKTEAGFVSGVCLCFLVLWLTRPLGIYETRSATKLGLLRH